MSTAPAHLLSRFRLLHSTPERLHVSTPRIEAGTRADYARLARFHYRAGPPATFARVLRAVDTDSGEVAGVLVVSMPVLNAPWRAVAWPMLFGEGGGTQRGPEEAEEPEGGRESWARRRARLVNAHVRTISRVVIDPRWRGVGLGSRLVRAYLGEPLTGCTEAVAAMGAVCPVFLSAGMREVEVGESRALRRLREVTEKSLTQRRRDAEKTRGTKALERGRAEQTMGMEEQMRWVSDGELRRWANDSKGTRRLAGARIEVVRRAAMAALWVERRVYVT